ncbi:GNAT family N-acetyltransferase [Methanobacterium sp. ACI-7]|uniref:GNAT family N-acetyltransferase n=1 Tax=unclassified Methanobacterium TaxID=2627676 RepID=UPI0039C05B78
MKSQDIAYLIDYNTSKFFLNLGLLNNDEVCDSPEIKYIFTKNWQSRIFMANLDKTTVYTTIRHVISRIKDLNISALWFTAPMTNPKNLPNLLKDQEFTYQNSWKAMAIDLKTLDPSFDTPKCLEIKEVTNLEELKIWTDILVKSFEFPLFGDSYKKYFINAGLNNLNFNYYLGFFNGKPVTTSILFKGEGAAGLFYIGTINEARRKGIANAMVNYLLRLSKNEGYNICVLQASEIGYHLYKKIGFKEYYTTDIYRMKSSY